LIPKQLNLANVANSNNIRNNPINLNSTENQTTKPKPTHYSNSSSGDIPSTLQYNKTYFVDLFSTFIAKEVVINKYSHRL